MPQVPTYFRNKLESSRTGIGSTDHSGAIIADSVKNLADTFFNGIFQLEAQQKRDLDASRRTQIKGDYQVKMVEATERIRNENLKTPDKAIEQLNQSRQDLRNEFLSGIDDGGLKSDVAADLDVMEANAKVQDAVWKIGQTAAVAQQNHLDLINRNSQALSTATYDDYLTKAGMLLDAKDLISRSFGSTEKGNEVVENGLEAYTKAFIYGQIDQGKPFEAAQLLASGKFDPFITAEEKNTLLTKTKTAAEGLEKKNTFLTAARASTEVFDVTKQETFESTSIGQFEEKISQVSFDIQAAKERGAPQEQIASLQTQQESLEILRNIKLEATDINSNEEDIDIKGQALARFQAMILPKKDLLSGDTDLALNTKNKKTTLDDVLKYQRWLTEQRYNQKISSETYQKYMVATEAAIQRSIVGNIKESGPGFKLDKVSLAGDRRLNSALQNLLKDTDKNLGKQYALDTMDFYLDALYDRMAGTPDLSLVNDETHKLLIQDAKSKAALKRLGYPQYLTVGDSISTTSGGHIIKAINGRGEPMVDAMSTLFKAQP